MKKVFYSANGPGDIIETYREWKCGQDDGREVSVTYSGQLYDVCKTLGLRLYAVSPHARKEVVQEDNFRIRHLPKHAARTRRGMRYFLAEGWHTLVLVCTCLFFQEDIAIVEDSAVWPLWAIATCFGVRIVAVLHCALWPEGFRRTNRKARLLQWLTGWFWEHCVDASLVVSPECGRQIRMIAPGLKTPVVVGLSHFRKEFFDSIPPPSKERRPFRIMFAGRVERYKGVFDMVRVAAKLEKEEPGRFCWEICGSGGDEQELRDFVEAQNLSTSVFLLGKLRQDQIGEVYGRCHAVIAPTTSCFAEGLAKAAAEAALAGRPLITSRLCHGLDLLAEAAIEVPPDNIEAYAAAVRRLADDEELYEAKRLACAKVSPPFFDKEQSWGMKLQVILHDVLQRSM